MANHSLNIHQDKISDIHPSNGLDSGDYLVPGLIDLQIYGADGELFSAEPSEDSISIIEQTLLKQGTKG